MPAPSPVPKRTSAKVHYARVILLVGWMGLIFWMSAQPDSGDQSQSLLTLLLGPLAERMTLAQMDMVHHGFRKAAHFTEYAILGLLWVWNLGRAAIPLAWGLTTAYAISDEFHQIFVKNRGPSVFDVGIDSLGALTALLVFRYKGK